MKPNKRYNHDLDVFYREDALSYYLLGAFITDGCVHLRKDKPNAKICSLASKDRDWVESIRDTICEGMPIQKDENVFILRIHSTELCDWLISKGCTPRKSLTLAMPSVPGKYLPDFVRGCFDGDGSICAFIATIKKSHRTYKYKRFNCYLCGASKIFLDEMSANLNELKLTHSYFECKQSGKATIDGRVIVPKNPIYRIAFGNKSAYNLLKWAYYPGHQLSMSRKKILAEEIIEHYEQNVPSRIL
jgi:hypothetical protein